MIQLINTETNVIVREFTAFEPALFWVQDRKNNKLRPKEWVIKDGEKLLRTSEQKDVICKRDRTNRRYKVWG